MSPHQRRPPARRPEPGKPERPLTRLEATLIVFIGGSAGFLVVAIATAGSVHWLPGWVFRFGAIPVVVAAAAYLWLRGRGEGSGR